MWSAPQSPRLRGAERRRSGEAPKRGSPQRCAEAPRHQLVPLSRLSSLCLRLLGRRPWPRPHVPFEERVFLGRVPLAVVRSRPGDLESLGSEEAEKQMPVMPVTDRQVWTALCGLSLLLPPGPTICQQGLFSGRLIWLWISRASHSASASAASPRAPRVSHKLTGQALQALAGAGLQAHSTCRRGPQAAPGGFSLRSSVASRRVGARDARAAAVGTRLHQCSST